jgi:hypothetical protein
MNIVFFLYEDEAIYYRPAAQIKKEWWNFFGNAFVSVQRFFLQTKVFLRLAN